MCSEELNLKTLVFLRVSVVTDVYLYNTKWDPKNFFFAIFIYFMFYITLFRTGDSLTEIKRTYFYYRTHSYEKKHCLF